MAARSRTEIHVCDIVISQIPARPVKMDEHKHDKHEDNEKKVHAFFQILYAILAKTRNLTSYKRFPGRIVDS